RAMRDVMRVRVGLLLWCGVGLLAACARPRPTDGFVMGQAGATARARADSARLPYTQADVDFMSGMIHHHAQAILISRWAATHGASPAVQRLTARIINAQSDEIAMMQTWLRDRNRDPLQVDSMGRVRTTAMDHGAHAGHDMGAMAPMPGMLTDAQLAELDAARGAEFDRLFLTYMMQHHRGAVTMVRTLFSARGAGQDETVFKFASDVEVDQSTEIRRMLSMLLEMGHAPPPQD
ncbi:MAG: DUF305 domain-containing protein, partial [Gemmatimonadaceae bacterium]|nr:DUF305 domain-containing protein [Gemmatimonadaceae bacterium]